MKLLHSSAGEFAIKEPGTEPLPVEPTAGNQLMEYYAMQRASASSKGKTCNVDGLQSIPEARGSIQPVVFSWTTN